MKFGPDILRQADLLATFSEDAPQVTRTYLSKEHKQAGEYLIGLMRDAGMTAGFDELGTEGLAARFERADQYLRDAGVFYRKYDGAAGKERAWPLAHVPLIIDETDWSVITRGLVQRVELLEKLMADSTGGLNLAPGNGNVNDLFGGIEKGRILRDHQYMMEYPLISLADFERDPTPLIGHAQFAFQSGDASGRNTGK